MFYEKMLSSLLSLPASFFKVLLLPHPWFKQKLINNVVLSQISYYIYSFHSRFSSGLVSKVAWIRKKV